MVAFVLFFMGFVLRPTDAGLQVLAPPALAQASQTYHVAGFAYYGPQEIKEIQGRAVVRSGIELCEPDSSVHDMIVVVDGKEPCEGFSLRALYISYNKAGAQALVYVSSGPFIRTGAMAFHHETWQNCAHCSDSLVMVHVNRSVISALPGWSREQELVLRLRIPKDNEVASQFVSPLWLCCFNIGLPVFGLIASVEAGAEVIWRTKLILRGSNIRDDSRTRKHKTGLVICLLEAPTLAFIGIALAGGLYGPYNFLPVQVANMAFTLFQGTALFTTLLLGLDLHEEEKKFNDNDYQQQSIFFRYRWIVRISGIFLLTVDMMYVWFSLTSYYEYRQSSLGLKTFINAAISVATALAGIFFARKARALRAILRGYLSRISINKGPLLVK